MAAAPNEEALAVLAVELGLSTANTMMTLEALWAEYSRRPRPAQIGATIGGVRLGELEDEIQDVITSFGMGPEFGAWRVARLGLAVADAERVLPAIPPGEDREYVALLAALGRAALASLADPSFLIQAESPPIDGRG